MVTGVVRHQQLLRFVRIARGGVEVDHRVVGLAGPDPLIDRLALRLAYLGVIRRAIERCQRGTVDLQPFRVSLIDKLLRSIYRSL